MFIPREAINFMAHWAPRICADTSPCQIKSGLRGEWVNHYSDDYKCNNVILYLHGGGYLVCSPVTHRNITGRLSKEAKCPVFALDYSLSPEAKYPTALYQALYTYKWLLKCGYKPENISVAGDSAGGNLTLCLISKLIEEGYPVPSSIACISPWCDLSASTNSITRNAKLDPLLPSNRIKEAAKMYSDVIPLSSDKVSPYFKKTFEGFPPTIFHFGSYEILEDEIKATFDVIQRTAKSECVIKEFEGCPHVFQLFGGLVPESTQSLKEMGKFMADHFQN